jgi:hypothetical protein
MTTDRRIEIYEGPDKQGRYHYALFWWADYHPGHPQGEHRYAERGQHFHGNPDIHGVPPVRQQDKRR